MIDNFGAKIVDLAEFSKIRPKLGKIVMASGGFDPIHPGHISYLLESKNHGDQLVVVVNGDEFLRRKKGRPFQNLETRCLIVSAIREVDYVVPFEIKDDMTVAKALESLKPAVFTKGGDRSDHKTIPEWESCQQLGIKLITGVGADKQWSSSWFLKQWEASSRQK